ncbi:MAG: DUF1641 domain-containing protein, partial [Anaerolineales bacterium]|nr:DUF1641 domain-containing protein [Anaerolineales bacterium]
MIVSLKALTAPGTVVFLGHTVTALAEAQATPAPKVGLWGMLRALNDPDRQTAIGFLLNFAKLIGQRLR